MTSFQFAEEDVKARQVIEARTEATAIIVATQKALARASNLISDKEKSGIQRVMQQLGETQKGDDHRAIRAGIAEAEKETHHLAEVLMDATLKEALESKKVFRICEVRVSP